MDNVDERAEILESIYVSYVWANNHKMEHEIIIKEYGKEHIDNMEDYLLYFWQSSEGIQLCMWYASLFTVINNINDLLKTDIFREFPLLSKHATENMTIFYILRRFRNYCFHIDDDHMSDRFINFAFKSNEDTFADIDILHKQVGLFIEKEREKYESCC